jgi:hypothetical protein
VVRARNSGGRRLQGDRGATTIALLIGTAIVLVLVTAVINVIVFQYGKGVTRAALDEGVRNGARFDRDSVAACETRATEVLGDLLGGSLGNGVSVSCSDDGDRVTATAAVHFDGWFGAVTDYDATLTASAAKESQ